MSHEKVLKDIKALNTHSEHKERQAYFDQLLKGKNGVMGIIISKPTGKCIGTIEDTGKINHVSHKHAKSPYNIVVKPSKLNIENMLMKNDLQGLTAKEILVRVTNMANVRVLGQTVDITGKIVGLIIRIDQSNNYIQTKKTEPLPNIPILAILHKARNNLTKPHETKKTTGVKPETKPMTGTPGKKPIKPIAPTSANKTSSKLAPNSQPDEDCVEPSDCKDVKPAEPVVAGTSASKPSALSGVQAKFATLWKKV